MIDTGRKMVELFYWSYLMKNKMPEIANMNKDYFAKYPKRLGWLTQVSPCAKGGYWDVEYTAKGIIMIEMVKHNYLPRYVASDRIVIIDDENFYDNKDT